MALSPIPRCSPFALGEQDTVVYAAGPALPKQGPAGASVILSAVPAAPVATAPAGSGVTVVSTSMTTSAFTGLETDIVVEISVASDATPGDVPITLTFYGTDGVSVKVRTFICPVRSAL